MSLLQDASLIVTPNAVKENKLYSITPTDGSGDLSVVRATSATRVDENGLIEVPRTNLLLWSEDFDNSYWTKAVSTIIQNSIVSPDGTLNADKIYPDSTGVFRGVFRANFPLNTYTFSVYAKKGEKDFLFFYVIGASSNNGCWFNLNLGTIGTVGSSWSNVSIEDFGNGWYRCSATVTIINSANNLYYFISDNDNNTNVTVNGTDGVYIWGAQLEQGVTATEYIPTTTSIRTKFQGVTQDGGSASNVARLDYTNGSCPSILVEPQRTNLVIQSEQINLWTAGLNTTVTPNVSIGPNGTQTANNINITNINGYWRRLGLNLASSTTYTASVFVKKSATTNNKTFRFYYNNNTTSPNNGIYAAVVNLTNLTILTTAGGTIGTGAPTIINSLLSDYGNGWYRVIVVFTTGSSAGYSNCEIGFQANGEVVDFDVWGFQLEAGSNATSYIPTTSATVTRNADVISKSGISDLIGQTEGTLFVDMSSSSLLGTGFGERISFTDGTFTNRVNIDIGTLAFQLVVASSISSGTISSTGITPAQNTRYKIAVRYAGVNSCLAVNGTLFKTIVGTIPTFSGQLSKFEFNQGNGSRPFYGNVNLVTSYKTSLTDDELIALTTL